MPLLANGADAMKGVTPLAIVAFLLPIALPAAASPDLIGHGGGGGGCSSYTVTFHVYLANQGGVMASVAEISVYYPTVGNFLDGQSTTLSSCTAYDIQPVILDSGYPFWYWYGSSVNIGNPLASSTWFTPNGNGVLSLIVKRGPSQSGWAGYIESTSTSFASVAGTLTLPTTINFVGDGITPSSPPCGIPSDAYDNVGYWIGIGGVNGNAYLWQAGVVLWVRSTAYYLLPFYETWGLAGSAGDPKYLCQFAVHAGDSISIQLAFGSGTSSGTLTDTTTGQSQPLPSQSFVPDTSTAEWAGEPPTGWTMPSTSYVYFSGCSSSLFGNLLGPMVGVLTTDFSSHALSPQTLSSYSSFTIAYGP